MNKLTALEQELLNGLTTKYPSLKPHIPFLKVTSREITLGGMCVNFGYTTEEGQLVSDDINALFSNGETIALNNLKKGLAYVIDVTAGEITCIEFMTYGEKWDGKFGEYNVLATDESQP